MKPTTTKPSPTERILADANRRPRPRSTAALRYAQSARKFAQRGAVAIRAARCELNSILLAKACLAKAELIGSAADATAIDRADRDVRALERALRDTCFVAKPRAKPRSR